MNVLKTTRCLVLIFSAVFITVTGAVMANMARSDKATPASFNQPISGLEARLAKIDTELGQLAKYSLRSGCGTVGFRSEDHAGSNHTEWIQINLGEDTPIDQIVLVPAIWRNSKTGFEADGFPVEFKLLAGTEQTSNTIATYNHNDRLLPRIAPLVISFSPTTASWVRLETTSLSPRAWDGRYLLQLSEIMIFNGNENVALRQPIETSSASTENKYSPRSSKSVVDGFVPYLMDTAPGQQSIAFVSHIGIGEQPSLTIDLGKVLPLNRIHLHSVDSSDTVPQTTLSDFLIPRRLLVEGANHPDFSDAVLLVEYRKQTIFDTGPIIMRRFPSTNCRYVRLTAVEPYINPWTAPGGSQIGFAEIALFSNGRNVARGLPVDINFEQLSPDRTLSALTDGRNLYGHILPIREWMNQLARRHDLETDRPLFAAELNRRYHQQKTTLNRLSWLTSLLGGGIVITVLVQKIIFQKMIYKARERIAANLHDELGANLHAIGMLGDMAKEEAGATERLMEIVDRIRGLTDRTGSAARYCVNMLEAENFCKDLCEEMKRSSYRLLADTDHEIYFEGEEFLQKLSPRKRIDLFLFYKECLTNIVRHASATRIATRLTADRGKIYLDITDNGVGILHEGNSVPASLKRRARFLKARLDVTNPDGGGTRIALQLKYSRIGRTK